MSFNRVRDDNPFGFEPVEPGMFYQVSYYI